MSGVNRLRRHSRSLLKTDWQIRGKEGIVEVLASGDVFKELDEGRQLSLGWYPPAWKPETWYPTNSFVLQAEKLYKCINGGKSQKEGF